MSDILRELQQKMAMKPGLEAKLHELRSQKSAYTQEAASLRTVFSREQRDVERLEGRSLANYFFQVIGKLDERLDQERQEAYAAKVKLDSAERELAGIESDLQQIELELADCQAAQAQYKEELEKKRAELKASGTAAADRILSYEQQIGEQKAKRQEIKEAICAGSDARSTADQILSELKSAQNWNNWDMFGGGGVFTHMAKHEHLDTAQDLVFRLQWELRQFKTELADIQISANVQVSIDGFLRFADYFFDSLFADWAVGDKISQSVSSVSGTKDQINRTLSALTAMEQQTDQKIEELNRQLDELIVEV